MAQLAQGMSYEAAADFLDIHPVSLLRLLRTERIKRDGMGGVDEASLREYRNEHRAPAGYMHGGQAARQLGIYRRHLTRLVELGVIRGRVLPGPQGTFVDKGDVQRLAKDPDRLAGYGIQVQPPAGWLTSAQARDRLGVGRSWLSALARQGKIRRRRPSPMNTFYASEDVERLRALAC